MSPCVGWSVGRVFQSLAGKHTIAGEGEVGSAS